ncbi:MAG: hypothetical protein ACFFHV_14435, partial [Promethearchaeota archaeon]
FNFSDEKFKKYMLPLKRSNILNYIIIAMQRANINKINIVIGENTEKDLILSSFNDFVKKTELLTTKLSFIENCNPERENGYSLYLGSRDITSDYFILSMADHVFSENIYSILKKYSNYEDILLATDPMKIKGIYDLKDCTKVFGQNNNIVKLGKKIPDYNRLDMGVFMMKTKVIKELSARIERENQNFGVSDVVLLAIRLQYNVAYHDFPNTIWLDIDNDLEYEKLTNLIYKSPKFRPFDLNMENIID